MTSIIETAPTTLKDNRQTTWSTPIPLVAQTEQARPYPIHALPNIIQNAITAYHQYGQQPLPLVACSALANVSLACQTLANVARDRLLVSPVSLFFLVIAGSGERKSAADFALSQATRQWQLKVRKQLEPEIKVAQALHHAWKGEKEGILNQIKRKSHLTDNTDSLKQRLIEIIDDEPTMPLLPVLFFEDATQEALASHIAHGWPSSSLWSDEGGIVMGGHGMQTNSTKFVALLNRLWDGKTFIAHRKTSQSFTVTNRRLTVSLMMQPLILEQMLAKSGGISRQSGFLARSLIAYPQSAMGNRYYQEPPPSLPGLPEFHDRLIDCLNTSLSLDKAGCHSLPTLLLSPKAKTAWVSHFNQIEAGLKNTGQWKSINDFASKAAENVARLAALLHLFEGKEGLIKLEQIEQATCIINWHLFETKMILGTQAKTPEQEDSLKLLQWILEKALQKTTPRYLQQFGPIRDKVRRDKAIDILESHHYVKKINDNGKTVLYINPLSQQNAAINP